ncbi:retention module-containing protein, partial [Niveibacterium umoris]
MATTTIRAEGLVARLEGKAWIRNADGSQHAIHVGDRIAEGQVIVTENGAVVELRGVHGDPVTLGGGREVLADATLLTQEAPPAQEAAVAPADGDIDKVIASLNAGTDPLAELDATAAGLGAGAQGEGHGFVRLLRITEGVDPLALPTNTAAATSDDTRIGLGDPILNQAPETTPATLTLPEDGSTGFTLDGLIRDPNGDTVTLVGEPTASVGVVTRNPDGTFTYTPPADFNGPATITYTVSDGRGGVTTGTISVEVTPVNDAPKATDVSVTTLEDTPVAGRTPGSDVDGDPLSFSKGTDPAHGTVTVNTDGTWVYTPGKNYNGADSFTVTVSDGHGGVTTATVNVGVTPVNDAPVTTDLALTTPEDTPVSGQVTGSDVDGDTLSYTKGSDPAHGTVVVNADGTFTYTPGKDYHGADSFTVTVSDGNGGTTTATVTVGVTPVNDAPVTSNLALTTPEDTPVSGQVTGSDVDGDTLSYTKGSDPAHGTVVVNADGTFTYTPGKDYHGADTFTVTVSDGNGGATTATVTVGVTPVNDAPVTTDLALTTPEDTPVSGQVTGSDVDGDTLSYTKGSDPAHGTVVVNADGTFTYTPGKDYHGADSFTVTVSDGNGGTTTATVTVGVTPVNDAPVTSNLALTTPEDTPVSGQVTGSDVDGDTLSYTKGSDPAHGTVVVNADGTFTYTPGKDYHGADTFTVTVSDGNGGTTTATVTVGVTPVNDAPVANNLNLTTQENTPINGKVIATDVDGDALSFAKASNPAHGSVVMHADGTFTYTPSASYTGSDSFKVSVSDGHGGTTSATVFIGIQAPNHPAIITGADTGSVTEDTTLTAAGKLDVTDVDAGQSSFVAGSHTGTYGSLTIDAAGNWTYALDNAAANVQQLKTGETVTDTITVTSADGTSHAIVVSVHGTDETTTTGSGTVQEDLVLTSAGTLTTTGVNTFVPTTLNGTWGDLVVAADGKWTYTLHNGDAAVQALAGGSSQTEHFTVGVSDGTTTSVDITVLGTNDGAVITGTDTGSVTEDTTLTAAGKLDVTDVDAGQSSFVAGSHAGTYGSLTIDAAGNWTYALDNAAANVQQLKTGETVTDTITVTSADGTSHAIVVSVHGTDETTTAGSGSVQEDLVLTSAGTLTTTGVNTFVPTTLNGTWGDLVVAADGKWTYTLHNGDAAVQALAGGSSQTEHFTVGVSDGTTTSVDITVLGTNDAAAITGNTTGTVTEDVAVSGGNLTTSGSLAVSDVDSGEAVFATPATLAGTYGTFTFNTTTGAWTYAANNSQSAIQSLGAGQSLTDSITVKSADGTASQVISVTINGANDGATIGGTATGTVVEAGGVANAIAGTPNASGTVTVS